MWKVIDLLCCVHIVRLAGPGPGAVLAGGLFAVSRLNWQWSVVAEVFTLNNLFVGLLFFLTASFHCAENATQRTKVTQCCTLPPSLGTFQFPLIIPRKDSFKLNSRCSTKMLDLVRLHIGERYAVAWGSVTSTLWCCMYWSSFPGSFTDFILTG